MKRSQRETGVVLAEEIEPDCKLVCGRCYEDGLATGRWRKMLGVLGRNACAGCSMVMPITYVVKDSNQC